MFFFLNSSLIPKQLKLKNDIHYQKNNEILQFKSRDNTFHDPLQFSSAPPVNKSDVDPLQLQKYWAKGNSKSNLSKEKDPLSLLNIDTKDINHIGKERKTPSVTEQVIYKQPQENFADHLKTSSSKRKDIENPCNSASKLRRADSADRFIKQLKRILPPCEFENYKRTLQKYQERRYTQNQIIDKTAELLFANANSKNYKDLYALFQIFGAFISTKNSQHYQNRLEEYRPRD